MLAHVKSDGGLYLGFCKSVDEEVDRVARITKEDLRVRIPMWRMRDIPELSAARG